MHRRVHASGSAFFVYFVFNYFINPLQEIWVALPGSKAAAAARAVLYAFLPLCTAFLCIMYVSKHWYVAASVWDLKKIKIIIITCAQMLMHAIAHGWELCEHGEIVCTEN